MLHQLAAARSTREIWWLLGAREPQEHPLAAEAHALLASLPHAREYVFYSATAGRLSKDKLLALDIPADASAYICGPASFMTDMRDALSAAGVDPSRVHTELFGALASINPGLTGQAARPPHQPPGPAGTGPMVTFARSGIATRSARPGVPCSTSPTPATSPPGGAAGPASATPAPLPCCPAPSATPRTRWNRRPTERCSSAAPSPARTSCWTCEIRDHHDDMTSECHRPRLGRCQPGHRPGARQRNAATTPASLSSPTRTVTSGSSRRSATAGRLAIGDFRGEQATVERLARAGRAEPSRATWCSM